MRASKSVRRFKRLLRRASRLRVAIAMQQTELAWVEDQIAKQAGAKPCPK